jgi:hypothetical protein
MSKQLAISAAFSTFAMAALAVLATPITGSAALDGNAGASNGLEAPARAELPEAPALALFAD